MYAGQDGDVGALSEAVWSEELRLVTGREQARIDAFMCDFWDVYRGNPNPELATYFGGLRPRYQTAFLSNSFNGARRGEERRLHLSELSDRIIYSHEMGVAKAGPRIYTITCERPGVGPMDMIFLDDIPRNIAAARDYGVPGAIP